MRSSKSREWELGLAIEAVARACELCREVQELAVSQPLEKSDRSPVTIADLAAQALIISEIRNVFPDDPVLAEEDASALLDPANALLSAQVLAYAQRYLPSLTPDGLLAMLESGRANAAGEPHYWVLDPLDGTKGFLRGGQYAVALALIERGSVVLGVLGCPSLPVRGTDLDSERGCLFFATHGGGAHCRPLDDRESWRIQVDDLGDPARAVFCESVESGHSSHDVSARIAERLAIQRPPLRIDSQCKYAAVARGDASIYLRLPTRAGYEEKVWDHAAGCLVVTEAGGRATDLAGTPLDFAAGPTLANNRGLVVTNGKLHDLVLAAAQAVVSEPPPH
ncbi:MAG: 3'(2'),5'-bisphosphate nucleotidase [Acidobacteriota bacterium]